MIAKILDKIIEHGNAKNDTDIARRINVSRQAVSKWRAGKEAPSDENAILLADMAHVPRIRVMYLACAARARTNIARNEWLKAVLSDERAQQKKPCEKPIIRPVA